jgi:hypothetical protein
MVRDSKGIIVSSPPAYRRPFGNYPFRIEPRPLCSRRAKLLLVKWKEGPAAKV